METHVKIYERRNGHPCLIDTWVFTETTWEPIAYKMASTRFWNNSNFYFEIAFIGEKEND